MGGVTNTMGLEHNVLLVSADREDRIAAYLGRRIDNEYTHVNSAASLPEYLEKRPDTRVVVMDFDHPIFTQPERELERWRQEGVPVLGVGKFPSSQGQMTGLRRAGLLKKSLLKPNDLSNENAGFFKTLHGNVVCDLYDRRRMIDCVGFYGIGEANKNTACEIAKLGRVKKILLYNGPGEHVAKADQTALAIRSNTAYRSDLEVHVADPHAMRANAGTVFIALGNIGAEMEQIDKRLKRGQQPDTLDFVEWYIEGVVESYREIGPHSKKVHVTNPVELLSTIGSVVSDSTFVTRGDAGNVEGFTMLDDSRSRSLMKEWGYDLAYPAQGSRNPNGTNGGSERTQYQPNFVRVGFHLKKGCILQADINGMDIDTLRRMTSNQTITREALREAPIVRGPLAARKANGAYVTSETTSGLVSVMQNILSDSPTYAAIRMNPLDIPALRRGKIKIDGETMRLERFWRERFPHGCIIGTPTQRVDNKVFPDKSLLTRGSAPTAEVVELAKTANTERDRALSLARAYQKTLPELNRLFEFYGSD